MRIDGERRQQGFGSGLDFLFELLLRFNVCNGYALKPRDIRFPGEIFM